MVGGERQHDVLDVVLLEDPGELIGRAQHRYVGQLLVQRQRIGVDETDQVEPVVGLAHDFSRDLLADEPGADDDRVLLERGAAPQHRAHDASVDRDGHDRDHPEGGHVAAVEVANGLSWVSTNTSQVATVTQWKIGQISSRVALSAPTRSRR